MWALVTKNGAAKPPSHRFAALWEPIWGLCGFIGQFLEEVFSETQHNPGPMQGVPDRGYRCTPNFRLATFSETGLPPG